MVDRAEHGVVAGEAGPRALTHLAGQSRVYLHQLLRAQDELAELREPDLELLLKAIERAIVVVSALNSIGLHRQRTLDR